MRKYAIKRLLQLIPILLIITFLSFAMMRVAGSDAVLQKMENTGMIASQDVIDSARAELGLDKPFLTQYFVWLRNLLRGDMGTSYISGKEVFPTFISKLPATLLLTVVSIALTIVISIPLGVLAAVKQNRVTGYLIRLCSFIGNSMPNFFVALLLMFFLSITLKLFPVISTGVGLQSVALPAFTLAIAMSAKYLRQVRATVLDEPSMSYAYSDTHPLEWLECWAPWLSHFHLHNNDGTWDAHEALSCGGIPMEELLHLADRLCPDATYTLEVTEAEPSVRWLLETGLLRHLM